MTLDKGTQVMIIMSIVNICNVFLVFVKGAVAYHTGSFSIANSTLETFGDVFVGFLLLMQRLQVIKFSNVLRLSVLEASLRFDPHLELEHIFVVAFNIFLKMALFGICFIRRDVDQVNVLLKDQGVDVITNSTAVLFAVFTRYYHKLYAEAKNPLTTSLEATRLKAAMSLEEIEFVGTAYVFYDVGKEAPDEKEEISDDEKSEDALLRAV
ncbi:unnamed protein product [Strongylus vulgaris]|uniref:Cation efflux protein cytoplasmic domain-containing protein n=1 Tax=Strongylus vulgaris TaxID=40348 RepID=A0A3P7L5M0_STRVU|nr:unnamed protein product [Strongylus vulgaris]